MLVRALYALVAAMYSMEGLWFMGYVCMWMQFYLQNRLRPARDHPLNFVPLSSTGSLGVPRGMPAKPPTAIWLYALFRGILAPLMILAHLIYLWPMRFDEKAAEESTLEMGRGNGRDAGATTYTILYQWLCNGFLPLVLDLGMRRMLSAQRDQINCKPLYPFRMELFANGIFAAVVVARFVSIFASSLFSIQLQWFYLAWSDPWPTIGDNFFTNRFNTLLPPLLWIFVWFVFPITRIRRDDVDTFSSILADSVNCCPSITIAL